MEIPETKRFIPKGFELGTTLSQRNWSICIGRVISRPRGQKKRRALGTKMPMVRSLFPSPAEYNVRKIH